MFDEAAESLLIIPSVVAALVSPAGIGTYTHKLLHLALLHALLQLTLLGGC